MLHSHVRRQVGSVPRSRRSMRRIGGCCRQSRRGATAVEMAFVAPLLFVFVFGLIEFGRIVMVQQTVVNAAREGCRIASLPTTIADSTVDAAVRTFLQSTIASASDPAVVTVNITPLAGIVSGDDIIVETQVNFSDVSWIPSGFLPYIGNPPIRGSAATERE